MKNLDDIMMELIQVREAIDMAEFALEVREDAGLRKTLVKLRVEESMLRGTIKEWNI